MELRSIRVTGGRLTTATLLVAEMAPTARDDCRKAFRNMLERSMGMQRMGGGQLQQNCNCDGEESPGGGDGFEDAKRDFFGERGPPGVEGAWWSLSLACRPISARLVASRLGHPTLLVSRQILLLRAAQCTSRIRS